MVGRHKSGHGSKLPVDILLPFLLRNIVGIQVKIDPQYSPH